MTTTTARQRPAAEAASGNGGGCSNNNSSSSSSNGASKGKSVEKLWGRHCRPSTGTVLLSALIIIVCPALTFHYYIACAHHDCELLGPVESLARKGLVRFLAEEMPRPTWHAAKLLAGWLLFQGLLYAFLPGRIGYGQTTPGGHRLPYVVNGLLAWFVSHVLFVAGAWGLGLFSPTVIHDNWGAFLVLGNLFGYVLACAVYAKALLWPSHPQDRKFSGSRLYDFYMGVELNPRLGKYWDFKLFFNGRPGIIAWTLINLSFAAAQYQLYGYVTNSMLIVNLLHLVYVVDFFINEDWYLRTIDIAHDHFGWMLAWGDSTWLPAMYTLQAQYLVKHPVSLSTPFSVFVITLGLLGYAIFRAVNHQKDICRRTNGKCVIWGKPARVIRTKYLSADGTVHESLLLASGFWGLSRHFNYVGDLMISSAMCLACGFGHLHPYLYIVYMTILLVHRIHRDDHRCRAKYGPVWQQYCQAVPHKLIPLVY